MICCELLSKFVSLWLPTTADDLYTEVLMLWITFKICIFVIANNQYKKYTKKIQLWITFKICIFVIANNAGF